MTGPEHYREAERLLQDAVTVKMITAEDARAMIQMAQVHATLALVAATALPAAHRYLGGEGDDDREWARVTA
jgi:hypothetical protein